MEYERIDDILAEEELKDQEEREAKLAKKSKKRKGKVIAIILAAVLFIGTAVAGIVHHFGKKNKNNTNTKSNNNISTPANVDSDITTDLNELGVELDFEEPKEEIVVTGDIDSKEIVTDKTTGKTYVNEEAKSKAKDVGTTKIVTPEGEKTVDSNGNTEDKKYTVTEKGVKDNTKTGNEVKDKNGKVISTSTEDIPSEYKKDEELNKIIEKNEVGKYTYSTSDYYDKDGNIAIKKGDIISKETFDRLEEAIKSGILFTTKPSVKTPVATSTPKATPAATSTPKATPVATSTPKATPVVTATPEVKTEGVVNKDGTFTIFGLTFKSKADYEQWIIQGYEGYSEVDGIMMSDEDRIAYQKS